MLDEVLMMNPLERNFPAQYEFVVDGELSERAVAMFPEMQVARLSAGRTSLFGPIGDQTRLRSLLARLDDMGLVVVELRRLPG